VPSELKELSVQSFWGAVASFILLQIFGYFIFQAFVFYFGSILMVWGIPWLLVFMVFQAEVICKIKKFIREGSLAEGIKSFIPTQKRCFDDFFKFFLSVVFLIVFIAFLLGYYPFPMEKAPTMVLVAFYVFSWAVSWLVSYAIRNRANSKVASGQGRTVGFAIGALFFAAGLIFRELAYFHGFIGLGVSVILTVSWLLEDQVKKP
jgi:hypothetical protein